VTVAHWFHVTSSRNRESILLHGLDWRYMSEASGIAGSVKPEQQGCFLCRDDGDVEFFVGMNNTAGPVDVWAVAGVDEESLLQSPEGFVFIPAPIPADRLKLVRRDVPAAPTPDTTETATTISEDPGDLHGSMTVIFRRRRE
jgi:hypothetical protein